MALLNSGTSMSCLYPYRLHKRFLTYSRVHPFHWCRAPSQYCGKLLDLAVLSIWVVRDQQDNNIKVWHSTHQGSGSYTRPKPLRNWSSFAVENNWLRPHPPERPSKIGIWIEKFGCQNSNLNLPTIKNGFNGYSYLKDPLRILKRI